MVQVIRLTDYDDYSQSVDEEVNEWIKNHKDVKIIDIKYNTLLSRTGTFRESVLIIYDEPTSKQDVTECSII